MNINFATNVLLIWPGRKAIDITLIKEMVDNGLEIIEYRPYANQSKDSIIRALIQLKKNVKIVLINNEIHLMKYCDGVWVGESDMSIPEIKKMSDFNDSVLIGKTVKNLNQFDFAARHNASMIGVGAIFKSQTKQDAKLSHWSLIQEIVNKSKKPAYLVGGLSIASLNLFLKNCNIENLRIAVSSAVLKSSSPARAFADLNSFVVEYRAKNKKQP
tara:strand:+ start:2302 stop:2946 length:645 start_codon:yes stop_codon:yes gene_type:complete